MKKALYISFLTVYLLLSVGYSVAYHLCGDFVMEVSVNSTKSTNEPEGCCSEPCSDDCCKTEFKTVKIDDIQSSEAKWELVSYDIHFVLPEEHSLIPDLHSTYSSLNNFNNSPPGNKTYLVNGSLLI